MCSPQQSVALSIAGSDPSGGAGIQADLKTFQRFGVFGQAAITMLTVQNTQRVERIEVVEADTVSAQIYALLDDLPPHAAKTGALGNCAIIEAVAAALGKWNGPLVIDPVMISKSGANLLSTQAVECLTTKLFPLAFVVTPNVPEAAVLVNGPVESLQQMEDAARRIADFGPANVFVKGGHMEGAAVDVLYTKGRVEHIVAARIPGPSAHGTGCALSAAITAQLALKAEIGSAVRRSKEWVTAGIASAPALGQGARPINFWA